MESCNWYNPACSLNWIKDQMEAFGLWIWDAILSGLAAAIEAIPVPEFLLSSNSFTMPPGIAYIATAFEIPYGLTVIVAAYTARFILRRIPGIG